MKDLRKYLTQLFDVQFTLKAMPTSIMDGLPLYVASAYQPYTLKLFSKVLFLAELKTETFTANHLARDIQLLQEKQGKACAIVLKNITPWQRRSLIKKGIPFIVPGRQMFLPMLLLDLREYFPRKSEDRGESLSWSAQLILLRQILSKDLHGLSCSKIALLLNYSIMTIINVRKELSGFDLCTEESKGAAKTLRFDISSEELWNKAQPFLRTPVWKRHWVVGTLENSKQASIDALAHRTSIQKDSKPVFAIYRRHFKKLTENNQLPIVKTEAQGDIQIEEWQYDPRLLDDSILVDPLSLYLSLKNVNDERVKIAVEEMMEEIQWLED